MVVAGLAVPGCIWVFASSDQAAAKPKGEITRTLRSGGKNPDRFAKQNLKPRESAHIRCVAVWSLGAPHGKPPPARPVRVSRSGVMSQRRARPRALAEAG